MTSGRRYLKLAGVIAAVWLGAVLAALLVVSNRVPVRLPSKSRVVAVASGMATFGGTWTIDGDKDAYPLQTSEILCERTIARCHDATARIEDGTLRVRGESYDIATWSDTQLVFTNSAPVCVSYIYTVDLLSGSVAGVRKRKKVAADVEKGCEALDDELHLTLADGMAVTQALQRRAMPWFGRLALFFAS